MIKEVNLPEVAENVEKGTVVKILVSVGDIVEKDQSLIEMETEKAALEVPSPERGRVTEILVKEGEIVKIGQTILRLDADGIAGEERGGPPADSKTVTERRAEPVPSGEEGDTPGGEAAPDDGKQAAVNTARGMPLELMQGSMKQHAAPAAPSVRKLARELGANIQNISGTGPGGRISIEDVKEFVKKAMAQPKPATAGGVLSGQALPDFSQWGEIEKNPLSGVRKVTALSVGYSWNVVPHVTQDDKADITEVEEFRKKHSGRVEKLGGKLTVTSILLKIIGGALKAFPQFNASIDMANEEIIYKKYYNVGIAVDTERGLLVPVVKDVDKKSIAQLSVELNEIAERARNKKIGPEEMRGGNFTISNLGGIGGTNFTPIVYAPQVAILGVSRARIEPVYRDGEFVPRLLLPLSLSYDHRLIDGADGIRFLRWIIDALEQPLLLSL